MTEEDALKDEKGRRAQALIMMSQHISESLGRANLTIPYQRSFTGDFKAEATFYCEENNYEYAKAKKAYDEDQLFEEE